MDDIIQDSQKRPKMGRPPKDDARRVNVTFRANDEEKRTIMDAFHRYGTAVAIGVILGAISQLEHDRKNGAK